jgi:hypothetical protein
MGNHLDITINELMSLNTDYMKEDNTSNYPFFRMLLLGYSKHGVNVFDKIYCGFKDLNMECSYRLLLVNNNMTDYLPYSN